MKGLKFRFSKTLIFVMGGLVVLGGGSGAAAVFIGTDKILGPSYLEVNGLACTTISTVKIKRDGRLWVRKYVTSEPSSDGMARVRTAMRIAHLVQEKEKADLVQVAMIDKAGPRDRAQIRGRIIGAQVVYIPDPKRAPEGSGVQPYSAYYLDGAANPNGEYYGIRIDLPLEDAEALSARLTDKTDCVDPVVVAPEGEAGAKPTGKKPKSHGEMSEKPAHGEAPAGEAPAAAAGEGHGEGGEVAAKESGGMFSSLTGMIFGSKPEAPAETHAAEGENKAEAPADGKGETVANSHAAPVAEHGAAAPTKEQASKPTAPEKAAAPEARPPKDQAAKPPTKPPVPEKTAAAEPKKDEGGLFASVKGMIFGSSEDAKPVSGPEAAPAADASKDKAFSLKDNGKDAGHGAAPAPTKAAKVDDRPKATNGDTDADEAGAEWLAKLRGEPVPAAKAPAAPFGAQATQPQMQGPVEAAPPKPAKPPQEVSSSDPKKPGKNVAH